jgi:xylulose-5-phosphate/fructose-6-phosphate phosphoketolase
MTESKNVVNLATFNKNPQPRWIDASHAQYQLKNGGASVFEFASDDAPWVIVAGVGDLPTQEALEGIKLVKSVYPELRMRFVNIAALSFDAIGTTDNKMSQEKFNELFGDWPVVVNYHGYADSLRSIIANYADPRRFHIHGYEDQGSTTSPLDELSRNHCSRWDIAADVLAICERPDLVDQMVDLKTKNSEYAAMYGIDE